MQSQGIWKLNASTTQTVLLKCYRKCIVAHGVHNDKPNQGKIVNQINEVHQTKIHWKTKQCSFAFPFLVFFSFLLRVEKEKDLWKGNLLSFMIIPGFLQPSLFHCGIYPKSNHIWDVIRIAHFADKCHVQMSWLQRHRQMDYDHSLTSRQQHVDNTNMSNWRCKAPTQVRRLECNKCIQFAWNQRSLKSRDKFI